MARQRRRAARREDKLISCFRKLNIYYLNRNNREFLSEFELRLDPRRSCYAIRRFQISSDRDVSLRLKSPSRNILQEFPRVVACTFTESATCHFGGPLSYYSWNARRMSQCPTCFLSDHVCFFGGYPLHWSGGTFWDAVDVGN